VSKSLGNFFTIGEILEQADPLALREYFLGSHYVQWSSHRKRSKDLIVAERLWNRIAEPSIGTSRGRRQSRDSLREKKEIGRRPIAFAWSSSQSA
jgi:cysteinyl-tRNA synthetase